MRSQHRKPRGEIMKKTISTLLAITILGASSMAFASSRDGDMPVPPELRIFISSAIAESMVATLVAKDRFAPNLCLPESLTVRDVTQIVNMIIGEYTKQGSGNLTNISISTLEDLQKRFPCRR